MDFYAQEGFARASSWAGGGQRGLPTFLSLMGEVLMVRRLGRRRANKEGGRAGGAAAGAAGADLLAAAWVERSTAARRDGSGAEEPRLNDGRALAAGREQQSGGGGPR